MPVGNCEGGITEYCPLFYIIMEITEQQISIDSNWFSAERDVKRTDGLHLSSILNFMEAEEGKVRDRDFSDPSVQGYMACGFLWERVLENLIERNKTELWEWMFGRVMSAPENPKVVRPGEQCLMTPDGLKIYMTPDGYHIDDMVLEEWKFTTKSLKNPINGDKFKRWISWQIPAYLGVLNLTVCRLRVLFARGDYTTGAPVWMQYMIEYTPQEISETLQAIVNNARFMRENGLA